MTQERKFLDFLMELTNLTIRHGVRVRGFHEPAQPVRVECVEITEKNFGSYSLGKGGTVQWHYHDKVPENLIGEIVGDETHNYYSAAQEALYRLRNWDQEKYCGSKHAQWSDAATVARAFEKHLSPCPTCGASGGHAEGCRQGQPETLGGSEC